MDALNQSGMEEILKRRFDNGADYWATPDRKLIKGSPFTTLESACMLADLGMDAADPVLLETARLIFNAQKDDGRFRLAPDGAIYPCHTIHAVRTLCYLGFARDERLIKTWKHLLETQYADGGWRCNKFSFGRGPETEFSNPGPTLAALDAFRFTGHLNRDDRLDRAVDFLLNHWTVRTPIGPCHYGIGSRFMQITYPFSNYNIFVYTYVLSFYERTQKDGRFLEAFAYLQSRTVDGRIVVERQNPKLTALDCYKQGAVSEMGTLRYREILRNLQKSEG
jgi:hypothetical protein